MTLFNSMSRERDRERERKNERLTCPLNYQRRLNTDYKRNADGVFLFFVNLYLMGHVSVLDLLTIRTDWLVYKSNAMKVSFMILIKIIIKRAPLHTGNYKAFKRINISI